ncbi:MAG: hypothetical protein DCC68_11595 [Planctomycetota bacterium]|nr:MAG: hypothetical protein DCC68_11595 [Planctomycetota bacterium]
MPTPVSVQIADAVVAELRTGQFTPAFAPVRRLLPVRELAELDELRVTVIPRAMESVPLARTTERRTYTIDIGVQQRVKQDVEHDAALVMGVAEEIAAFLFNRSLSEKKEASYVGHGIDPIYSPEHLEELRVATSVVTVRYTL